MSIGMTSFTESVVEDAALAWLESLGYEVLHGPDIAAGEPDTERNDPDYCDAMIEHLLHSALLSKHITDHIDECSIKNERIVW